MNKSWVPLHLLLMLALSLLLVLSPSHGLAATDDKEAVAPEADDKQNIQEIGKQLNNPVSSVWNITTQSNMTFLKGNLSPAYRGQFTFNFQPVCPIPLTKDWNLIPRPLIPLLSTPFIRGRDTATGSLDWSRTGRMGGYGFRRPSLTQPPQMDSGVRADLHFPHGQHL
jgi:hypothetical protein